jgi:type III pantothenate kinase
MLFIDAGNTRLKWARADAGAAAGDWRASGALGYDELVQPPAAWQGATQALYSNVAGDAVEQALMQALGTAGVGRRQPFRTSAACAGISNGYRDPTQLGSDRFATLIAARHRYPSQALLVVTCGTATTIDALDRSGRFIGGMILPGLLTMAKSLAVNTAQLPEVKDVSIAQQFADNTRDAIVSGCMTAQAAAIDHALRTLQASEPAARCLLSGGAAAYVAPWLASLLSTRLPAGSGWERIDNLVLLGLHVAAIENGET